jgi:hypothetical protein
MKRKKFPLPWWERVGERGDYKKTPPPFYPLPPGEGIVFWIILNIVKIFVVNRSA